MSRRLRIPQKRLKGADMLADLNAEYFVFFDHRSRSQLVAA